MVKKIKINALSSNDVNIAYETIDSIYKNIDKIKDNIVNDLSDVAVKEMETNYNTSMSQQGRQASTTMSFGKEKTSSGMKAYMEGQQAIYEEFGTGTKGAMNNHENKKSKYHLKQYNSGETIRVNNNPDGTASKNGILVGTLYWTYKDSNGRKVYTQGNRAGMEVYKASKVVRERLQEIIKKRLEEHI